MSNFFDIFDTVKQAESGSALHFKVPATGELAYNGETPVTVTFKGPKSASGQAASSKLTARASSVFRKYKKDPDAIMSPADQESLKKFRIDFYSSLAVSWTGFESQGKEVKFSADAVAEMLSTYLDLYEQTKDFFEAKDSFLKS